MASSGKQSLNTQLTQLEKKSRQLSIINQFSLSLLQLQSLDELLKYVCGDVVSELGFVDCVIYLCDEDAKELYEVAAMGEDPNQPDYAIERKRIPFQNGITGHVARHGIPLLIDDVLQDERYLPDVRPARSELCVPLIFDDQVLGVIDCEHPNPGYFNDEHLEILTTVAHLLSAKINQVRTLEDLKKTVDQLNEAQSLERGLLQIANLTYLSRDLDELYSALHQIITQLLTADNFFIGLYNRQKDTLEIVYIAESGVTNYAHKTFTAQQLKNTASLYLIKRNRPMLCNREEFLGHISKGHFQMVGKQPESWLGVPFAVNEHYSGVIVVQSYDASFNYSEHDLTLMSYISGQVSMAIERQLSRQALEHKALHDELTGLPNRSLLIDRLNHAISRLRRRDNGQFHALFYLDFDRFKSVNDSLGHEVGDQFLIAISRKIGETIRKSDTFARLGGDEFAVLLEDLSDKSQIYQAVERIHQALQEPLDISGHLLQGSTSIGVALAESPDQQSFSLLQQADAAMYEAKAGGRSRVQFFNKRMQQKLKGHADIETELQQGIKNGEFELYYQPIFDIQSGVVVSFEALVRWHHPVKGLIAPNSFIPVAEQTGQIIALDLHLLEVAAKQLKSWLKSGKKGISVTVNVSSRHFTSLDFAIYIDKLYDRYGLPDGALCLEITESGLIENLGLATDIINRLALRRVKLCLDDFGTGYSALGYLHQLPIQVLKIDKSFVDNLSEEGDNPLVDAILTLAKSLELEVVAEGIEHQAQLRVLQNTHCDFGQGYLKAKPMPADDAVMLFRQAL